MHSNHLEHHLAPSQQVLAQLQQGHGNATSLRLQLKPLLAQAAGRHELLLALAPHLYLPMWRLLAPQQAHWLCRLLLALQKAVELARLRGAIGSELGQLLHDAALARWAELPQDAQLDEASLLRIALQHLAIYANLPERALLQRLYLALSPRQRQHSRLAACLLAQAEEAIAALPYAPQARPSTGPSEQDLLAQLAGWLSQAPASPQVESALRRRWVAILLQTAPDALVGMLRDLAGVHWQAALVACLDEAQLIRLLTLLLPPTGRAYLHPPAAQLPQIERQLSWCRLLRRALQADGEQMLPRDRSASFQLRMLLRYGAWPACLSRGAGLNLSAWLAGLPDSLVLHELALLGPTAARQLARLPDAAFQHRVTALLLGSQHASYQRVLDMLPGMLMQAGLAGEALQRAERQATTLWLAGLLVRGQARPSPMALEQALLTALILRYSLPGSVLWPLPKHQDPIVVPHASPERPDPAVLAGWRGHLPGEALTRHHNLRIHC